LKEAEKSSIQQLERERKEPPVELQCDKHLRLTSQKLEGNKILLLPIQQAKECKAQELVSEP
jgi:hypothetical protein